MTRRTISVLGSTGSVGSQTLSLISDDRERFSVRALVAGRNVDLLARQARAHGAEIAVVSDPACLPALREALAGSGIEAAAGAEAIVEAASRPVDWTMAAISGAAGLAPTLAAITLGRTVALANKEALVCAGDTMLAAVRAHGATLLPVDSEHNAIFQSMADGNHGAVERITLTASGGPFRTATREEMRVARPEQALKHPVWSMGAKISIDSATMMNKGLELIEAARLFGMASERIEVLVHPQSVVHGLVHYTDGSVIAQLGSPDMRVPIAHTLGWPARLDTAAPRLDLARVGRLDFDAPDLDRFPALVLARDALIAGGTAPALLSAANEVAVQAFLDRRIGFLDIVDICAAVLNEAGITPVLGLDDVIAADADGRRRAAHLCDAVADRRGRDVA